MELWKFKRHDVKHICEHGVYRGSNLASLVGNSVDSVDAGIPGLFEPIKMHAHCRQDELELTNQRQLGQSLNTRSDKCTIVYKPRQGPIG